MFLPKVSGKELMLSIYQQPQLTWNLMKDLMLCTQDWEQGETSVVTVVNQLTSGSSNSTIRPRMNKRKVAPWSPWKPLWNLPPPQFFEPAMINLRRSQPPYLYILVQMYGNQEQNSSLILSKNEIWGY